MARTRRAFLTTASAASVVALAGCTTGSQETTTTDPATEATTTADTTTGTTMAATVGVSDHESLGEILVDSRGMTLYMFEADTQGAGESTCYGSCAGAWPPLVAGDPTAGAGVTTSLSTFARDDGSMQVAANGWPLYGYAGDQDPGDATGQGVDGFGGLWWVLAPDGTPKRSQDTTTETTTTGGGDTTTTTSGGPSY